MKLEVIFTLHTIFGRFHLRQEVCPLVLCFLTERSANYRVNLEFEWSFLATIHQTFMDRVTVDYFHILDCVLIHNSVRLLDLMHWVENVLSSVVLHLSFSER